MKIMKKFIIPILAMLLFSINTVAQAQIIKIDRCLIKKREITNFWNEVTGYRVYEHIICLSNGDILRYSEQWGGWQNEEQRGCSKICQANFVFGKKYPEGTLVYKAGNNYELVNLQKRGILTIKKVSPHQVSSEFNSYLKGDFSYSSFLIGYGRGHINGSASGGTRTVVNVFFDNGTSATMEASQDPIWMDAEPGMKVEYYSFKDMNIYKLL